MLRVWLPAPGACVREHVRTSFSRAPDDDRPALRDAGVAEVFTPGASTHDIVAWVRDHLGNVPLAVERG
jgi:hypothetical protein